jgi:formamidopyrimidine-DNA glycosylase
MPELPDLQVFSANLQKKLKGQKLMNIKAFPGLKLVGKKTDLKKLFLHSKVDKVFREGKELRFLFDNKQVLGLHLMLHGKLYWKIHNEKIAHTIALLEFDKDTLGLSDFKRNARLIINPPASAVPDAISKSANPAFWRSVLQSRANIKNILLDQHLVKGIGNAYADEILWTAGISPFSVGNKIPDKKIKELAVAVKNVLNNAAKQIKKKDPGIIGGEIRDFLLIHNSKIKTSPGGRPVQSKSVGGRKTYFTDEQELFK